MFLRILAQPDGDGVHAQHHDHQHEAGGGGVDFEGRVRREVQLKIWIGITVKGDISQSNRPALTPG